jgi:hypothetical protein
MRGSPDLFHGDKLGIDISHTTVTKYVAMRWHLRKEDLLRNHAVGIAALDMFVVPTISFRLLYGCGTRGGIFCRWA